MSAPGTGTCGEVQASVSIHPRPGSCLVLSVAHVPTLLPEMPPRSRPLTSTLPLAFVQSGIVQLLWEAGTAVVYTCSLDGIVRLWDARTGRLLTDYRGHTAEILDFALSK